MKKLKTLIILALLPIPSVASAQLIQVNPDPQPRTERCQNHQTAFHADGDIVRVDYHGQWREHSDGGRTQNGGPDYSSCATDAIARVAPSGEVLWRIRPTQNPGSLGITRSAMIYDLQALPDGSTLISAGVYDAEKNQQAVITRVGASGNVIWTTRTQKAPKFSHTQLFSGDNGAIFISLNATNYAYDHGVFQLAQGPLHKLKASEPFLLTARLDPKNGQLLWERETGTIIGAHGGEITTIRQRYNQKQQTSRFHIERISYEGKLLSKVDMPAAESEQFKSAIRHKDEVWISVDVESRDASEWVVDRVSKLHIFGLDGKARHTRSVSDGAHIARNTGTELVHVLSPANCTRAAALNNVCVSDALQVLALKSGKDEGVVTQISVPSQYFDYYDFAALSTSEGVWVSAQTYDKAQGAARPAEAVIAIFSADAGRFKISNPRLHIWKPIPRAEPKKDSPLGIWQR